MSYLKSFAGENPNYKNEIFAGLTVAMTMIPESLSFAILAGLSPLSGLYAAFIMGLFTALFGGRPGMVSGGAGATVIVLIALMKSHGVEYVFGAVALAGIIQFFVGLLKLGKFVRLIPQSVMYGFVNGLAIVIFMSQLEQFKVFASSGYSWLSGNPLYSMAGLVMLTIAVVLLFPKITKFIPSSLVAILVVFAVVAGFNIPTKTVADMASIAGGFPPFHIPSIPFTWEAFTIILPYAGIMACVGLLETLLTLSLVDEITKTRGSANRECMAQGGANLINGFFTGMGGCAMIAQTFVNLEAGSKGRLSGVIAAVTILLVILFGAPLIGQLPMAALVGVMMIVALRTFNWGSFSLISKVPISDMIVIFVVTAVTVIFHNLALAVFIGVVLSALVFCWESSRRIRARKYINAQGVKNYELYGPLFFGSVTTFLGIFDVHADPEEVILDFKDCRISDLSAMEALNKLAILYKEEGKHIKLIHLSEDCIKLLNQAKDLMVIDSDLNKS